MRALRLLPWVLLALLLAARVGTAGAESSGTAVVDSLHRALADNMREDAARAFDARVEALRPVIAAAFDFATITRVALGRAWGGLTPAQQQRFEDLMQRLSVATYAARFTASKNAPRFVTLEEKPGRRGARIVRTRLEPDDGAPVALDYVLRDAGEELRIINVLAEGVSDLSLKRAQFTAVIRDHGVDELLRRLEAQIADLADEG